MDNKSKLRRLIESSEAKYHKVGAWNDDDVCEIVGLFQSPRLLLDYQLHGGPMQLSTWLIKSAILPRNDYNFLLSTLVILQSCCVYREFSLEFGACGGHINLKKLTTPRFVFPAEVMEYINSVTTTIISSKCHFPLTPELDYSPWRPITYLFCRSSTSNEPPLCVYTNTVDSSMHGKGQHSVGYVLWSSATILARFCLQNSLVFRDKNVLEIGSGIGLSGIVVGHFAAEICLSDYNIEVLHVLKQNVQINKGTELVECHIPVINDNCRTEICLLDWNKLPKNLFTTSFNFVRSTIFGFSERLMLGNPQDFEPKAFADMLASDARAVHMDPVTRCPESVACTDEISCDVIEEEQPVVMDISVVSNGKQFDVIIGSDVICCEDDALGVIRVLCCHLTRPAGVAVLVVPQPQHRFGTEVLIPALVAAGFWVFHRPVIHSECMNNFVEASQVNFTTVRSSGSYIGGQHLQWADDMDCTLNMMYDEMCDHLADNIEEKACHVWNIVLARWPMDSF